MFKDRSRHHRKNCIRLEVTQKRREPLDRFRVAVGGVGSIHQDKRGQWRYQVNSANAEKVRDLLWPFLSVTSREKFDRVSLRLAA